MTTARVLADVLADDPDTAMHLAGAHDAAWVATDRRRLELCRLRIATLLGCDAELAVRTPDTGTDEATISELASWPTSAGFDSVDRACLAFCEQFVVDVAGMDDSIVAAVTNGLGDQGATDFVNALLVIEQRQRLRMAWEQLL